MAAKFAMSTLQDAIVEKSEGKMKVRCVMSCTHDYYSSPEFGMTAQLHRNAILGRVGHQERCKACEK